MCVLLLDCEIEPIPWRGEFIMNSIAFDDTPDGFDFDEIVKNYI